MDGTDADEQERYSLAEYQSPRATTQGGPAETTRRKQSDVSGLDELRLGYPPDGIDGDAPGSGQVERGGFVNRSVNGPLNAQEQRQRSQGSAGEGGGKVVKVVL